MLEDSGLAGLQYTKKRNYINSMNQGTTIAGALIAGAVIFSNGNTQVAGGGNENQNQEVNIAEITERDHLFGNPNAPIKIVEYSDFECPFCSRFHPTVEQVVQEFDGEVAWVYRHFPLNIHANAEPAAEASECVAELGGNDAFWSFSEELFNNQRGLGESLYLQLAAAEGVSESAMQSCLDSDRHLAKVRSDMQDAINAGGRGTPFSVVIGENGDMVPFSGALPYESVVSVINSL